MSAVRRLQRAEWEKRLREMGCFSQDGLTKLNTAEWWRWPFKAPPFTVPVDDEGCMDQWAFLKLVADMAVLAPKDWEFTDPYNS